MKYISDERIRKAEAYKALPIALVIRPLKHLIAEHTSHTLKNGVQSTHLDIFGQLAKHAANRGDGLTVQRMARNGI